MGVEGNPGYSSVWLLRILWGKGRLGVIEVSLQVWSRWSIEIPEALAVVREVFIWHSMKPLDLG